MARGTVFGGNETRGSAKKVWRTDEKTTARGSDEIDNVRGRHGRRSGKQWGSVFVTTGRDGLGKGDEGEGRGEEDRKLHGLKWQRRRRKCKGWKWERENAEVVSEKAQKEKRKKERKEGRKDEWLEVG